MKTWSSYLGDPRLELVRLFAIRLHYFGAGTEHGLCLCNNKNKDMWVTNSLRTGLQNLLQTSVLGSHANLGSLAYC